MCGLRLAFGVVVSSDEWGFLLDILELAFRLAFLYAVEQIHYLFGSLLDQTDQIGLFEPAIHYHLRNL